MIFGLPSELRTEGFGQRFSWLDDESVPPKGHRMTFKQALHTLSAELITVLAVPQWVMGISSRLRTVRLSIEEVQVCLFHSLDVILLQRSLAQKYMLEMIAERRYTHDHKSRCDLLSLLMGTLDDGEADVTDRELTGLHATSVCIHI